METGSYLRFFITALLTAFAGAQVVHVIYRPLDDLDKLIEEELTKQEQQTSK